MKPIGAGLLLQVVEEGNLEVVVIQAESPLLSGEAESAEFQLQRHGATHTSQTGESCGGDDSPAVARVGLGLLLEPSEAVDGETSESRVHRQSGTGTEPFIPRPA